jgi:hypothetical protein
MSRLLTCLAAVLVLAGFGLATTAQRADAAVTVGIGEQSGSVFTDPLFTKQLKLRYARNFQAWNVALVKKQALYLDQWIDAATAAHVQPLISFSQALNSKCPRRPCHLPTLSEFTRAFKAFHKRWPEVRTISPWNEANHRSQPTWKNPKRAAQFYNVVRKYCRGCTIVAADVIDETNMVKWLKDFRKTAIKPRIWGLHNYRDTNKRKGQKLGGTKLLMKTVKGQVWLTETGGIVRFVLPGGKTLFKNSPTRAADALRRMFRLASQYRSRIKRLYIYNWYGTSRKARFDAGLVDAKGKPRPGYGVVKRTVGHGVFSR